MTDFFVSLLTIFGPILISTYLVSTIILTILLLVDKPKLMHAFLWFYGAYKVFTMTASIEFSLVVVSLILLTSFASSKLLAYLLSPHPTTQSKPVNYHVPKQSIDIPPVQKPQSKVNTPANQQSAAPKPASNVINVGDINLPKTKPVENKLSTWDTLSASQKETNMIPLNSLIQVYNSTNSMYFNLITSDQYQQLMEETQNVIDTMWNNFQSFKQSPTLSKYKSLTLLNPEFSQIKAFQQQLNQLKFDYHNIYNGSRGEQVALQLAQLADQALLLDNISVDYQYENGKISNNQMDGIVITSHGISILEVKNYEADKLSIEDKPGVNDLLTKYHLTLKNYDEFGNLHAFNYQNRYQLLNTIHDNQRFIVYRKSDSDNNRERIIANNAINTQIDNHKQALLSMLIQFLPDEFYPKSTPSIDYLSSIIGCPLVYMNYDENREPHALPIEYHGSYGQTYVHGVAVDKLTDYLNHQHAQLTFEQQQLLFNVIKAHQSAESTYPHAQIVDIDQFKNWLVQANQHNQLIASYLN